MLTERKLYFQEDPGQHVCPLPARDCRLGPPSGDQQVQLLRNMVQLVSRVTRRMIPSRKHVTFHQGDSCLPVLAWQAILRPGRKAAQLELQLWYIICRRLSSMIRLSHLFTTVVLCGMTELRSSKHYSLIIPFVGAFSRAMYGDSSVLLKNPELVADTWLNFASALWYL